MASPDPDSVGSSLDPMDRKVHEWTGQLGDQLARSGYNLGNNFSNALWDNVSDFRVFSSNNEHYSLRVDAARRIFDNHDINNTYTVADNFNFRLNVPLFSKSKGLLSGNVLSGELAASFGVSLGTAAGIELMNIRQVSAGNANSIPAIQSLRKNITSSSWYTSLGKGAEQAPKEAPAGSDLPSPDEPVLSEQDSSDLAALNSLPFLDPLRHARYGDFWNILNFPVRIPFRAKSLKDLQAGEIISYNLYGAVQVGASIGWGQNLTSVFKVVQGSVSYSAYLRGDYRITVLKEDDRYARVKITRTYTDGRSKGINSEIKSNEYFHGIVVFGHRRLEKSFTVVPFRIQVDTSNAEAFDVGYRYDLTDPEASKAYELAMLGRFGFSDELSGGIKGAVEVGKNVPVEKIFTRTQNVSTDVFTTGVSIASFYQHSDSSAFSDWDAVVTLPDGTRRIVSTDTQNVTEWKTFWGTFERTNYTIRVKVDVDRYNQGSKDALYLVAEGSIEDSNTNGSELRRYELQTEEAVGQRDLFPKLPIYRPLTPQEIAKRDEITETTPQPPPASDPEAEYGPSNFYFRMMYGQLQLDRFIDFPEDQMWTALEKAFEMEAGTWDSAVSRALYQLRNTAAALLNIPLYLFNLRFYDAPKLYHAEIIRKEWLGIREKKTINERAKALGHLFTERMYGRELIMLLRTVLHDEEISYTVTATNQAFGRIFKQGQSNVDFYPMPDRINKEVDFDRLETRTFADDSAQISKIWLTTIRQGQKLDFTTTIKPQALYIKLVEEGSWYSGNETLAEYVIGGAGYLKQGDNTLYLTESSGEPWATLARLMEKGTQYRFSLAVSADGQNWGPIATITYFVPGYTAAPPPPQNDP